MVRVSRGVQRHHEIHHGFHHCVQDGLPACRQAWLPKELRLGEDREVVRHEDAIPEGEDPAVVVGVVRLERLPQERVR